MFSYRRRSAMRMISPFQVPDGVRQEHQRAERKVPDSRTPNGVFHESSTNIAPIYYQSVSRHFRNL